MLLQREDRNSSELACNVMLPPLNPRLMLTLYLAWWCHWDMVDLSSRQSQLVALELEGDRFTALTR